MEISDDEVDIISHTRNDRDSDGDRGILSDEAEEQSSARQATGSGDEETKRRIKPSVPTRVRNRRILPKLDIVRLRGPKGLQTVETYFEGFKFRKKGEEKIYLKGVMKRLEYWAHRLFPKYQFDDFLEKMETLGTKKEAQVFIKQCRLGLVCTEEVAPGSSDEDRNKEEVAEVVPFDAFDALMNNKEPHHTTEQEKERVWNAATVQAPKMTDEVKARIEANRKAALERKLAREKERLEKSRNSQAAVAESENHSRVFTIEEKSEGGETGKRQELEDSQEPSLAAELELQPLKDPMEEELDREKTASEPNVDSSSANLDSNAVPAMEEILEIFEGPSEENCPNSAEMMETSRKRTPEETLDRMECNDSLGDPCQALEKTSNDSDRLLTREELLEAIDGAMEEIIGNKEPTKIRF